MSCVTEISKKLSPVPPIPVKYDANQPRVLLMGLPVLPLICSISYKFSLISRRVME